MELGHTAVIQHEVRVMNSEPIHQQPYQVPTTHKQVVTKIIGLPCYTCTARQTWHKILPCMVKQAMQHWHKYFPLRSKTKLLFYTIVCMTSQTREKCFGSLTTAIISITGQKQ